MEALLEERKDSFEPATAKRASAAAEPLAAWVKATVRFARVCEKIKPLEDEQNRLKGYIYKIYLTYFSRFITATIL